MKHLKVKHIVIVIVGTVAAVVVRTAIHNPAVLPVTPESVIPESPTPAPTPAPQPAPPSTGAHVGPNYLYPDPNRTPGITNPAVTQSNISQNICNPGWTTKSIRPPVSYTNTLKQKEILSGYTYNGDTNLADYELDHLIALTDGGNPTSEQNLWPQPYHTQVNGVEIGAHQKDNVEVKIHGEICSGAITLARGQEILATEWYGCWLTLGKNQSCQ